MLFNIWLEQGFGTLSPYTDFLVDTISVSLGLVTLVCLTSMIMFLVPEVVPNPDGDPQTHPGQDVTELWNHRMVGLGRVDII